MKNNDKQIIKQAEEKITSLFESASPENLLYHSIEHTKNVVDRANEIAAHYELSVRDIIGLNIGAWFHDVGHLYTDPSSHEQKSAELMREWLADKGEYAGLANEIERVILATKLSVSPQGLVQEIIKDADTYHFGTPELKKMDKLMKKEMSLRNMPVTDWEKNTLVLLDSHQFYTSYCKELLEEGKQKNIAKIKKKIELGYGDNSGKTVLPAEEKKDKGKGKDDKTGQSGFITKGIQTMLRLTSENHMRLSEMADNKANILISVNAIIISVILSVLIRKIEVDKHLAIPTFIFLASALITIVISILATRPKITSGIFTREDILNRKTNLLFFGNFFKSELTEYKWGMSTMMKDPEYLYGALVDDIYYLGKVLGRKYNLVRLAYGVFMVGIIVSAFAFIIAILFHQTAPSTVIIEGSGSPF
ncbi:MAG: Pycsar system effector family protein [Chitinophagaceae bacterium]